MVIGQERILSVQEDSLADLSPNPKRFQTLAVAIPLEDSNITFLYRRGLSDITASYNNCELRITRTFGRRDKINCFAFRRNPPVIRVLSLDKVQGTIRSSTIQFIDRFQEASS